MGDSQAWKVGNVAGREQENNDTVNLIIQSEINIFVNTNTSGTSTINTITYRTSNEMIGGVCKTVTSTQVDSSDLRNASSNLQMSDQEDQHFLDINLAASEELEVYLNNQSDESNAMSIDTLYSSLPSMSEDINTVHDSGINEGPKRPTTPGLSYSESFHSSDSEYENALEVGLSNAYRPPPSSPELPTKHSHPDFSEITESLLQLKSSAKKRDLGSTSGASQIHSSKSCIKYEFPRHCHLCNEQFLEIVPYLKHQRNHLNPNYGSCPMCGKLFDAEGQLEEHMKNHAGKVLYKCLVCNDMFYEETDVKDHIVEDHPHKMVYCSYTMFDNREL